jgi:hypothetical protein
MEFQRLIDLHFQSYQHIDGSIGVVDLLDLTYIQPMRSRKHTDNLFARWMRDMEAREGRRVMQAEAARWLGKSERVIRAYHAGTRTPQQAELRLMHAIAQGYRPTLWQRGAALKA